MVLVSHKALALGQAKELFAILSSLIPNGIFILWLSIGRSQIPNSTMVLMLFAIVSAQTSDSHLSISHRKSDKGSVRTLGEYTMRNV